MVSNPFADLDLPTIDAQAVAFYERAEAEALYAALQAVDTRWRVLVELGMDVGLRPGELYGLGGHRVDWMCGQLAVVDVLTRAGIRQYPKSMKSRRTVPIPPETMEAMSTLVVGRPRDSLVFVAAQGGPLDDANLRLKTWYPAVEAAGIRRPAANHAAHRRQLARAGWGEPVQGPSLARSRELRHDPAVRQNTSPRTPTTR